MLARTLLLCSASAVAGMILVLACGDDAPTDADAAEPVCDCPAAEPPLAGRIVLEERAFELGSGAVVSQGTSCDLVDGQRPQILSGGCKITDADVQATGLVTLIESFKGGTPELEGWSCSWRNETGAPVPVAITLTCLLPPPAAAN